MLVQCINIQPKIHGLMAHNRTHTIVAHTHHYFKINQSNTFSMFVKFIYLILSVHVFDRGMAYHVTLYTMPF